MRASWCVLLVLFLAGCSAGPGGSAPPGPPEPTASVPTASMPSGGASPDASASPISAGTAPLTPVPAPGNNTAEPAPASPVNPVGPSPVASQPAPQRGGANQGGANAAPNASFFDASTAAAANYRAWLVYEMNSDGDLRRGFESEAYPDGAFVCAQLALRTPVAAIEGTLAGTKGWSGTGAAAIVKGAVNALCPAYNQGYTTYFDRSVTSASTALGNALQWSNGAPPYYEVGYFMKEACGYLQKVGTAQGLEAHLHSFRRGGALQGFAPSMFIQRVLDDQLLRRATHHAVFVGCLGDHLKLNAYWTMA